MAFGIRSPDCSSRSLIAIIALLAGAHLTCCRKNTATLPTSTESGTDARAQARRPNTPPDVDGGTQGAASIGLDGPLRVGPWTPPYVARDAGDLANTRTLYVVNYSHLDTQWRWSFPQTIERFLPYTIKTNIDYFKRFPSHILSWTGASRYQLMKEYYPDEFQAVKDWVKKGRWFPAGNQWEECDVLVPSSESIIRQVLVGNGFFQQEFGTESQEFMLPDSFGFPASLPSILAHMGLRGFSTQKLTWKSAAGIPFNVGKWKGVDGRGVIAALNPGSYGAVHKEVLSTSKTWAKRLAHNGSKGGLKVDYLYNGTGDIGGPPHETSMKTLEKSVKTEGPVKVIVGPADLMFRHISDAQADKLPSHEGDLLLTEHSAGSLTSQAFIKRQNRMNELLADAAERASVAAALLNATPYPAHLLEHAWRLTLRGQFHDILPGTSLPKAYEYSWNDEFVAMNEFAYALMDAVAGIARGLDTRVAGVPTVVYNPLSVARTDLVEAEIPAELQGSGEITAIDADGVALPTQMTTGNDGNRRILFSATVPAMSFTVFGLRALAPPRFDTKLNTSNRVISNARYRVTVDDSGDVSSVYDSLASRELLASSIRYAFLTEWPSEFPAWNMDWADRTQAPRGYVQGEPKIRVTETGPLRVALQVERESERSLFVQTVRLAAGAAGDRIEFVDRIDWKSSQCSLKATFPLRVSNAKATYSWDLGTVQRGNNNPKQYEVPTHSWFDLTDAKGDYGVTVLTSAKYGSDKPSNDILRLTLLFTPAAPDYFHEQQSQDWGRHDIVYGLVGHPGDFRKAKAHWHARRLEQPLLAFAVPKHEGKLGKTFSLFTSSSDQVAIQAVKRSEDGKSIVIRLQELLGREARLQLNTPFAIAEAWEMTGMERRILPLEVEAQALRLDFLPNQLRTVSVSLQSPHPVVAPSSVPVPLGYDLDAVSSNANPKDGDCNGMGASYPTEMLDDTIRVGGIEYKLGPFTDGKKNALVANGQTITLPPGYARAYVLAASVNGPASETLRVGAKAVRFDVAHWTGFVGQWDNRIFAGTVPEISFGVLNHIKRVQPAYLRTDRLAWAASHLHQSGSGDIAYAYAYLFSYAFEIPSKATTLTLPQNPRLRIFAITVANDDNAGSIPLVSLWPDLSRDASFHERFDTPW